MKKIRLLIFIAAVTVGMLASGQVPQMIDYQGMARDGSGNPLANTTISVRMSVWQGPLPGSMVYSEKHTPATNSYGLFHLMIGDGSILSGNFTTIPWSTGNYYIQTEIDPAGGNSFIDMGRSQLATVPFAFYAANSGGGGSLWSPNPPDIYFNAGFVGIGTDSPTELLHIDAPADPAVARISSTQSYFQADATGNTGLWMQEGGADVAWLYWNPPSQAVFMYENGNQTMAWKNNKVGAGTLDPLVKMHVIDEGSAGVLGSDLGNLYSPTQMLSPAIYGFAENNSSDISYGVMGHSYSTGSSYNEGVFGEGGGGSNNNYGVYGVGKSGTGSGYNVGIYGDDDGSGSSNYAGYFNGDVNITGTLSKSGGSFKIDHPQDPANKYLVHSFVESPDMMNIYNGNVVTDAGGYAVVELPAYFDVLNIDFRYQLTVIGTFAQAIIKEEISGNQFTIMTDQPNVKVSWQVTGVRNDVWAQENRIGVEVNKPAHEKGLYLHPELYNKSADMGLTSGVPHEARSQYKTTPLKEKDPLTEPVRR